MTQDRACGVRGGLGGAAGRGQQQRQQCHQRGESTAAAFLPVRPVCGAGDRLQFRDELRLRGPLHRILGQTSANQFTHLLGDLVGGDGCLDVLQRQLGEVVARERLAARQALEEGGRGRVDVGGGGGGSAGPLLRGHVGRGSRHTGGRARVHRDAEVDELGPPVGHDQDVLRLVVAVDDADAVGVDQSQQ